MGFEKLKAETVYNGRAFSVEKVEMRLPDERVRSYDLVRHNDSVTIVPVDDQGNLLFVSQYRVGLEQELLELPAGVMEAGETPAQSAEREVREETGMAARVMEPLGGYYLAPGYTSEQTHAFLARGLYPDPLAQDDDEFLQVRSIPIKEAYRLALDGAIKDFKSLAALLLARPRLEGK